MADLSSGVAEVVEVVEVIKFAGQLFLLMMAITTYYRKVQNDFLANAMANATFIRYSPYTNSIPNQ